MTTENRRKDWLVLSFLLYCAVMLWLLFFQRQPYDGPRAEYWRIYINLTPFVTLDRLVYLIRQGFSPELTRFALGNIGGNVVLFMPPGLLLPSLWKRQRRFWVFFLTMAVAVAAVELIQWYTTLGSLDVDDLILNLLGGSLGFVVWKWMARGD